jgi:thiol-disulfide isomerase/thioredoxin
MSVWLVLALTLSACGAAEDGVGLEVGQRLPDAEFVTFAGEKIRVSELAGRPAIINFWATWCGPCKQEIPVIQAAYERNSASGLQFLAVTDETQNEVRTFYADFGMSFPVLFDQGGAAGRKYRVQSIPTTIFIDRDGVVVARHIGVLDAALLDEYLAQALGEESVPTPAPAQPAPTDETVPAPQPTSPGDELGRIDSAEF